MVMNRYIADRYIEGNRRRSGIGILRGTDGGHEQVY